MEECAVYFNKSDPLRDAILFNEEETPRHPCLIQGELKVCTLQGYVCIAVCTCDFRTSYFGNTGKVYRYPKSINMESKIIYTTFCLLGLDI